jgi:serine/threonine protein kinase/tetratricopeptide (TPR) repeat protein
MSLAPGTRLGPYEIVAPLGAGGMGEVYRARDSKLKREVAIKVLPDAFAKDAQARARFEREALAVAALSHPNILSIYDFGSDGGIAYAVMELLEGETLRAKLAAGPPSQKLAMDYALQIAKGLSAAHQKGVVHRDLKPENVFVDKDGHVKILDFGLAKRTAPEAADDVTSAPTGSAPTGPGTVMGTLGYMSPEQARGRDVDHRSDIFSFGAMLYELLSGAKAFKRDSAADTMAAILNEEPPALSESGRSIPLALEQIIKHCLEKSAGQRFQSARDVVFALETLSSPLPSTPIPSPNPPRVGWPARRLWLAVAVATLVVSSLLVWRAVRTPTAKGGKAARIVVLPFENLGSPEDTYLAAGLTEEVISRLANVQGLSVISRTTAIGYDRKGKTIAQIGADLGVAFVLEGTVQCERQPGRESRVRITPQLIQVADDSHLWADRYDRVLADIFAIQSEVAESVVSAMGVKLLPREKTALKAASTNDMEAYGFYLRGLEFISRSTSKEDQEGALRMFQAAVDRDPRFTQALARLARTYAGLYHFQWDRSREHVKRAKDALDRLVALGPDLAETHIARGYYHYWGLVDYPRALDEFKAAFLLQPGNSEVLEGISAILRRQGRWQESAEESAKVLEMDPRSSNALLHHGQTCVLLRRYEEAARVLALAASFNPQAGILWAFRVRVQLLWHGDVDNARSLVAEAGQVPRLYDTAGVLAYEAFRVALIRRDFRGALRLLEGEKREAFYMQFFYLPIELLRAETHRLSGENDLARLSFEASRRRLQELIAKDPDDSRYHSALGIACAGLGLREEALRAAQRGSELMPPSKDLWRAPWRIKDLALVHTMLGQQDEAIDQLDSLLSRTGEISTHMLRLEPRWDPLRANPRFQALLAKYGDPP